jgi:crotonobetainyl-CoA:carnitine CoA-transferase CaiB-like acyl-CoA transferase
MTIAGGIMGALYHRERTGEATVVDISLLSTGMWAQGLTIGLSLVLDMPWAPPPEGAFGNPLSGNYQTKDGSWIALTSLQAGKYWPSMCEVIGRPELATDPRFSDHQSLLANTAEATAILKEIFLSHTLAEWRERLEHFTGQWAVVQHTLEAANDPQSVANGYIQDCETAGGTPFKMVSAPVQYDGSPGVAKRAPEFNEHGDEILGDIGLDSDAIIDLKVKGVVA